MPAGVFNMIFGNRVGADLVQHPAIQAVGFTGSLQGGRALFDLATRRPHPIPVFAEMSSINPVVILPQALARAAHRAGTGLFLYARLRSVLHQARRDRRAAWRRLRSAGRNDERLVNAAEPQPMLNTGTLEHYSHGLAALDAHPGMRRLAGRSETPLIG